MPDIPEWDPLAGEAQSDPRAAYDRRRAACPVARSPGGVTLFRHADVVAAASRPDLFSSAASGHRQVPNSLDPPEHTAYRAVVDAFFTPERMRRLEPRLAAAARALVAALPRGPVVEVVGDLGYPFAVRAQTSWLGWQGAEDALVAWMREHHAATRAADRTRAAAVAAAFDAIALAEVRRRREAGAAAPSDPTTELLGVRVDGQPLADADVVSILRNWTAGDLGSMAAAIGVVVHFLATHPDVQDRLRRGEDDPARAVDEMLRMDDPFLANRRVVTADTAVAGFVLARGTRVYLNWASANRDERVFPDPDAYRPDEHAAANLVYGTGIHACPGRPLATLELVVVVRTLLACTRHVALAAGVPAERETYPLGGWRRVPVRLS